MTSVGLYKNDALLSIPKYQLSSKAAVNEKIAIVAGLIVGIAASALYTFLLIRYVNIPNSEFKNNPNYDSRVKTGVNSNQFIPVNQELAIWSAISLPFGQVLLPFGVGFGVYKAVLKGLNRLRVKPLKDLRSQLEALDDSRTIHDYKLLVSLIKRVDDAKIQKLLLLEMNFNQLSALRLGLGQRKFLKLIAPINLGACREWKEVNQFGKLDIASMERALSDKVGQELLRRTFKYYPEARREMISIIRKQKDPEGKKRLAKQVGEICQIKPPQHKDITQKTVVLEISGKEYPYSEDWIRDNCATLKDALDDVVTTDQKRVIPLNGDQFHLLKALQVAANEDFLPESFSELQELAVAANYLGMDSLILMIGDEVIQRAIEKKISKIELLRFLHSQVPNEEAFEDLRAQGFLAAGVEKIASLPEMMELWPLTGRFGPLHELCTKYYEDLLKTPELFRSLYEAAQKLKSEDLQKKAIDHLKGETPAYRMVVFGLYSLNETVPKEFVA